jgi:hypothetical protein
VSRPGALALLLVAPFLLGARDPVGDVVSCSTGVPTNGPDLLEVRGVGTELGTVAEWRLTFDRPIRVPSDVRIDVVVRDPRLPGVRADGVTGVNRIVRWDATSEDRPIEIVWLPHDGSTTFNPPTVEGSTVDILAPGRLLLGESANGTESVRRARWSVVVRSDGACDRLGLGIPKQLLAVPLAASPSPLPVPASTAPAADPGAGAWAWVGLGVLGVLVALTVWSLARSRSEVRSR